MNMMSKDELDLLAGKVFESIDEGIMVTDRNQVIVYVNASFCALTGYAVEEVVGQSPQLLSSGFHSDDFYQEMWKTIRTTGSWQGEIRNRRKNGEIYIEELSITQVLGVDGSLTHYVGIFKDITSRKELEAKVRYQAQHDMLTGLPNRILLQERLQEAIQSAEQNQCQFSILYIDLDRFKKVNDNLGHHAGDKLLTQAAARMRQCLRESDTVARIGGDELVVLLTDISTRSEISAIAGSIRSLFEKPFYIEGHELFVTCSIGISVYPEHSRIAEDLVKQADQALYEAKHAGGNNFRYYNQSTLPSNFFSKEKAIREALLNDQLRVFFQPVCNTKSLALQGMEALVRWNHPDKGMIPPAEFIPIAEESDLILLIDRWVMRHACLQLAEWHRRGHPYLRVAVNLSMKQFQQPDLLDTIRDVLQESGIPPASLVLEITEQTLMQDPESSIQTMHKISDLGVRMSLDDFGIGYSSFTYLKQLPIHTLKIDRSFVKDIAVTDKDFLIIKALINMAHSLKLNLVAEGVETQEQLSPLIEERCDLVQGFYFSRPIPAAEFEAKYLQVN